MSLSLPSSIHRKIWNRTLNVTIFLFSIGSEIFFKKNLKRKCVMTVSSYCPRNCRIKREHKAFFNHSFRTFTILTNFPLKFWIALAPMFDRGDKERVRARPRKKCEFDMILIFKLHISLLFISKHSACTMDSPIVVSGGRKDILAAQCATGPRGVECSFNI